MKLTRRHINVLRALAASPVGISHSRLPDGNGHYSGGYYASGKTLAQLRLEGLIALTQEDRLYVITEAGRAILSDLHAERAKP